MSGRFVLLGLATALLCMAVAADDDELRQVTGGEFQNILRDDDEVWVFALTGNNCNELCEEVRAATHKISNDLKGLVNFAELDVMSLVTVENDDATILEIFNITTLPRLLIFGAGFKTLQHAQMVPAENTVQAMRSGQKTFSSSFLRLVQGDVMNVMVASHERFLAKTRERPHVLLFSNKKVAPPMLQKLALEFNGRVEFGLVHQKQEKLVEKFGIEKFPTIVYSERGAANKKAGDKLKWEKYEGALKLPALREFFTEHVDSRAKVPHLERQNHMDEECSDKGGICVILIAAKGGIDEQVETLKQAAERNYNGAPLNFMWFYGEDQENFVDAFDLNAYPAVIALNPRKKKFAPMVESYTAKNVRNFILHGTLHNEVELLDVDRIPLLAKTGKQKDEL